MAPKKKGEGGKKGRKEAQSPTKAIEDVLIENREFYLIQIRDLENRLDRYKKKWDEMSLQEKIFQEEFEQLAHNKKEVVSFLKRTLNQRVDEITDLNSQLQGLQISKEMEKDAFEAQLAQVRHEFQETKDQLTMENIILGGKLAALEEFQFQKTDLMSKFSILEEQLKKQQDDYKSYVYHMEKKALMDKERLRRDIIHRMNIVAAEFRKVSRSRMSETTKRAIRENMVVAGDLAKMNTRTSEQLKENRELKESKVELCKQVALLERNEKNMVKNSLTHMKMIRLLSEKYEQQQEAEAEVTQLRVILSQSKLAFRQMEEDKVELKNLMTNLKMQLKDQQKEGQKLIIELEKERNKRQSLEVVLANATCQLRDLLVTTPEKPKPGNFDLLFQLRRKEILQQLLAMLNEAVSLGPRIPEFVPSPFKTSRLRTLMTIKESSQQPEPTPLADQLANIQPYRIGDLGLVPRPPSTPENGQDDETFRNLRPVKAFSNPEIPSSQILKGKKQMSIPAFHL